MTDLCRRAVDKLLRQEKFDTVHPGLWLMRGLAKYPQTDEGGGGAKASHLAKMSQFKPSDWYRCAFERWQGITSDMQRFRHCQGRLEGRLYVGVTRDNALETGVTVSHSYGMPMIPGSAVKGVCRAAAREWGMDETTRCWIFGHDVEEKNSWSREGWRFMMPGGFQTITSRLYPKL